MCMLQIQSLFLYNFFDLEDIVCNLKKKRSASLFMLMIFVLQIVCLYSNLTKALVQIELGKDLI